MKISSKGVRVFNTEEELRRDIIKKLKQSEAEIERGEGIKAEIVFKEWRQKYGY